MNVPSFDPEEPVPTFQNEDVETYVDVICGLIQHVSDPVHSILISGPSGNGKTHIVKQALARIATRNSRGPASKNNGTNERDNNNNKSDPSSFNNTGGNTSSTPIIIPVFFPITEALTHAYHDRSTGLRSQLTKRIAAASSAASVQFQSRRVRANQQSVLETVFVVVLDHIEVFTSTSVGRGGNAAKGGGGSVDVIAESCNYPSLVVDMHDVIRARPLVGGPTALDSYARSPRIVFLTLFSGNAKDRMDTLLFRTCFDCHIIPGTPSETERRAFFRERLERVSSRSGREETEDSVTSSIANHVSPIVADDLAARTGGIFYQGLVEISEISQDVFESVLSAASQATLLLFAETQPMDNAKSEQRMRTAKATSAFYTQEVLRRFFASNTQACLETKHSVGYVDVPSTRWTDIAGLADVKKQIHNLLLRPLSNVKAYAQHGVLPSTGLLLHGPPGTGKTMLARAMATELNASFVYLDLPQLIQGEVGESEKTLNAFFEVAMQRSPTVMFIDELQAAFGRRYRNTTETDAAVSILGVSKHGQSTASDSLTGGSDAEATTAYSSSHETRLVSHLLALLDKAHEGFLANTAHDDVNLASASPEDSAVEKHRFVLFVGATNIVERLDPLLLRPGRLDTQMHIPLPDAAAREQLVRNVVEGEWSGWWESGRPSEGGHDEDGDDGNAETQREQRTVKMKDVLTHAFVARSLNFSGADLRNALNLFAMHVLSGVLSAKRTEQKEVVEARSQPFAHTLFTCECEQDNHSESTDPRDENDSAIVKPLLVTLTPQSLEALEKSLRTQ